MTPGSLTGRPVVETSNLLDVDPDLAASLGDDARAARHALKVVLITVPPGACDLRALISGRRASAAVVLDGLISRRTLIGSHAAVELIWPSDLITPLPNLAEAQPFLVPTISWTCEITTRLALLPPNMSYVAARWPVIADALHERVEARHTRLATIHAIAQVPRAEERLRLLLWLLAGRFGRVSAEGVVLDLRLSYRTIGELIGARRPTLSLAMKALRASGEVAVRDDGALILHEEPLAS